MAIAIKEINETDKQKFADFLKSDRVNLPQLKLASLAFPHEDIAVIAYKKKNVSICEFCEKHQFVLCEHANNIVSISRNSPLCSVDNSRYLFSGYTFYDNQMLIGMKEVAAKISDISVLKELYGEFSMCVVERGDIMLSSDFFGMVPWFYFDNDEVFAASNNYHLLLLLLKEIGIKLSMNIARSRVNIITSGFTYGSSFSKDLDVYGCKMNLAYEEIRYSAEGGVKIGRTSLWDILCDKSKWDDELYEEYIYKAKQELEQNCRAAFEHPRFNKIVVDVSGGFDSRIVFATACNLPQRLRKKLYTHTRKSGTSDDVEKASALTNLYNYPKHSYVSNDTSELFSASDEIKLDHVSRTLGTYSVCSYLYTANYDDFSTLEITGYLGEVVLGYMRCRGELDYSLGDKRLLSRLGGCYLWNSVKELEEVFQDQEFIINDTLSNYNECDCLFKKFQRLYIDSRNRFICGSSHNIENNNMRIPMLFSKYALKAKWLYFNKFKNNEVPDEKVSLDLLTAINPLLATLPFTKNNDNVIPRPENLLNPSKAKIEPDYTYKPGPKVERVPNLYKDKVIEYMDNLETAEQMILHIYDYSEEYYPVCLGLYKVLSLLKEYPSEIKTTHARETVRKIYDVFYQIKIVEESGVF